MIKLDILLNIVKQFAKAYNISNNSLTLFGDLSIMITMSDFY